MATTVPLHNIFASMPTIATQTLAKNDWQLLSYPDLGVDLDTFAGRVLDTAQTWSRQEGMAALDERYLTRATQHEYAKLLYTACTRKDTPAGQRAYLELWNRYSRMVRFKMADHADAQDVTQNGMKKIYEKLAQCDKPGAFLGWAYTIMRNEVRQYWRQRGRQPPVVGWGSDALESDDTAESRLSQERLDPTQLSILQTMRSLIQPSPEEQAAEYETDQILRELIRRCLQHETRSLVFQRLVLNGAEVSHLAILLDRTPNAIHMLRHHALKKLRQCPELLAMLQPRPASPVGGAA